MAVLPSSSSILRSRLYLATRSVRASEPVLIWPARVATARSAMKVSSVSPERGEEGVLGPAGGGGGAVGPAGGGGGLDGVRGLGQRADLVDLDQQAVGAAP